ncbi:hypothetical protein [Roseivirga seohaensis]|uniref:hypothetical protein n=1 Tax=Roseivirga seohaensis TaxID=1914963 RepID=UPI0008F692FF|nr:hypothetical protein [Roseivirga seohaensis]
MDNKLLNLHFTQLSSAWRYSKENIYSDAKKNEYHSNLKILHSKLSVEDFSLLDEPELLKRKVICDFFFKSLEFLNSSTLNHIPFEIVKCLELALCDWIDNEEDFLIVTSLVNDIHNFSFDPSLAFNEEIYNLINSVYGIEFKSRLIQINLPAHLDRDYLANVVLYHELGHFVDYKLNISKAIYEDLLSRLSLNQIPEANLNELVEYFPYIKDPLLLDYYRNGTTVHVLMSHLAEYFCDLFASQYIHSCSNHYLNYLTQSNTNYSQTHPSTTNRIRMVDTFLKKEKSFPLALFEHAVLKCTSDIKELKVRYETFDSDNFERLIPVDIENNDQLHYLFTYGWNIWLNSWVGFKDKNDMGFDLNRTQVYHLVNNLIEKSIGNHILVSNWEKFSE